MTSPIEDLPIVLEFVKRINEIGILSTGARVVDYKQGLYNVSGSTHDPKEVPGHFGRAWKRLLIEHGISEDNECYVTEKTPNEGSHPKFLVGGHMTPNEDGSVTDGVCYLMPLCGWHNSTSKNGIMFKHKLTKMLKLTGYLEGELEATFKLRLPSADPFAILFYDNGEWKHQNLSEQQAATLGTANLTKSLNGPAKNYVLFKRVHEGKTRHVIEDLNLLG